MCRGNEELEVEAAIVSAPNRNSRAVVSSRASA